MTRQLSNDDWLGLGDDHTPDIDFLNNNEDDDDVFPTRSKQVSPRRNISSTATPRKTGPSQNSMKFQSFHFSFVLL